MTAEKHCTTASSWRVAALGALLIVSSAAITGCHHQARPGRGEVPPGLEGLAGRQPEEAVVTSPERARRDIEPARTVIGQPRPGGGVVRLTREGRVVERSARAILEVAAVATDTIRFSRGYVLWHRLPPGHAAALRPGARVELHFQPTSTGGSDEVSVTLYEAAREDARGAVVLQTIERGGVGPVRIGEAEYVVEQLERGELVLDTEAETTTHPTVRVVAGENRWLLAPGQPLEFPARGANYRITLLRSLRFQPKPGRYSAEGPEYLLEYVLTRATPR